MLSSGYALFLRFIHQYLLLFALLAIGLWALTKAKEDIRIKEELNASMRQIPVKPPIGAPPLSQDSIGLAMTMYGIEVPSNANYPRLDLKLRDRGLTSKASYKEKSDVSIGPAAFTSWALLGSTLAHELEVHCQQNFMVIALMDLLGLDGTGEAERLAYAHELRYSWRFGLAPVDAELIADTMEFYYPYQHQSKSFGWVRRWVSRHVIISVKQKVLL